MRPDDLEGFGPVGSNGPNLLPRLRDAALGREGTVIGRLLSKAADALEEVREDAERYRWLRSQNNEDFSFSVVKNPHFDVYDSAEELDAAIDLLCDRAKEEKSDD